MSRVIMYEKIYRELLTKIEAGEYAPGDCLPTERELAETYQVSRITAKKAMDLLTERGTIVRTPGKGSFVQSLEQGFEPKHGSMGLEEPAKKKIGVVFDTFDSDFGSRMIRSIERECTALHMDMLFKCTYGSVELEKEAIQSVLQSGAQGIILMCAQGENYNDLVLKLALKKFPLVLVDRPMSGISIPCVKTDNYEATKELTRMLINEGHEKICFLSHSYTTTMSIRERYDGFVNEIMEHENSKGVLETVEQYNPAPENVDEEYKRFDYSQLEAIVRKNEDATAYIAAEYRLGLFLNKYLKNNKISKSIATFDGIEEMYENDDFIHVRQNEEEMGKKAVRVLTECMDGQTDVGDILIPYEITFPRELETESR